MKKIIVSAMVISMATSAMAQEQRTYTLTVSAQEMVMIMNSLSALPYKDVVGLINKLGQQAQSQSQEQGK